METIFAVVFLLIYPLFFSLIAFSKKEEENLNSKKPKTYIPFSLCLISIVGIWTYNLFEIETLTLEIIFILILAVIIFYFIMEFGFEKMRWWISLYFLSGGLLNYISSFALIEYISKNSDVSVEKISILISNSTVLFYPSVLLIYTATILVLYIVFYSSYLLFITLSIKTKLFKYNEKSKKFRKSGLFIKEDHLIYLLLLITASSLVFFVHSIELKESSIDVTDRALTFFMGENNNRCDSIENNKLIYFYDINRIIHYSKDSEIKYKDSICNIKTKLKSQQQ